jgi:hypothetical protein
MLEEVDSGTGSSLVGQSLPGLAVNLIVVQVLCLSRLLLTTGRPLPLLELFEKHCLFFRFTSYKGLEFVFEFWLLLLEIARIETLLFFSYMHKSWLPVVGTLSSALVQQTDLKECVRQSIAS